MSTDNVTPIRAGAEPPSDRPKRPRPPAGAKACHRFHLKEPVDETDNQTLLETLHGICRAGELLGRHPEYSPQDVMAQLASAGD